MLNLLYVKFDYCVNTGFKDLYSKQLHRRDRHASKYVKTHIDIHYYTHVLNSIHVYCQTSTNSHFSTMVDMFSVPTDSPYTFTLILTSL